MFKSGHNLANLGETGEKWAIAWESTLKNRIKLVIPVLHKTLALPINRSNSDGFLAIFPLVS